MKAYNSICRIFGKKVGNKPIGSLLAFLSGGAVAYGFNTLAAVNKIGLENNVTLTPFGIVDFNAHISMPLAVCAVGAGVISELGARASMNIIGVSRKKGHNIVPRVQAASYALVVLSGMGINSMDTQEIAGSPHQRALEIMKECDIANKQIDAGISAYKSYYCPN